MPLIRAFRGLLGRVSKPVAGFLVRYPRSLHLFFFALALWAIRVYIGPGWKNEHWVMLATQAIFPFILMYPFAAAADALRFFRDLGIGVSLSIGIAIAACATYVSGRMGFLTFGVQMGIWFALFAWEAFRRFAFLKRMLEALRNDVFGSERTHRWNGFFAALVFFICAVMWTRPYGSGAAYPPFMFDLSLVHLSLVKTYLYNHEIVNPWWIRAPFLPQFPHAIYSLGSTVLIGFGLRGDLFATFFMTFMLVATIASATSLFEFKVSRVLAMAVLALSVPVVRWHLSTAYLDLFVCCYVILAIVGAVSFDRTERSRDLFLMFFAAGAAFTCKHFGAIMTLPIVLATMLRYFSKEKAFSRIAKDAGLALAATIPILMVFFHTNYVLSGKPLFPFQFAEPNKFYWTQQDALAFNEAILHYTRNHSLFKWLTLPWQIVVGAYEYCDSGEYDVGFVWLVLMAIATFGTIWLRLTGKKRWVWSMLFFTAIIQMLAWYKSSPVYRYLTPQIWVVAILAFMVIQEFGKRLKALAIAALVIVFFVNWTKFKVSAAQPPPLTEAEYRSYGEKLSLSFEPLERMEAGLGNNPDVVIYTLHDEGAWLFYPYPFLGDWFGQHNYSNVHDQPPEKLRKFFSERAITHVLVNGFATQNADFIKKQGAYGECYELAFEGKIYDATKIYRLKRENPLCFDASVPVLESIADLKKKFPRNQLIPLWPSR